MTRLKCLSGVINKGEIHARLLGVVVQISTMRPSKPLLWQHVPGCDDAHLARDRGECTQTRLSEERTREPRCPNSLPVMLCAAANSDAQDHVMAKVGLFLRGRLSIPRLFHLPSSLRGAAFFSLRARLYIQLFSCS